jgi:hypothetical protein
MTNMIHVLTWLALVLLWSTWLVASVVAWWRGW